MHLPASNKKRTMLEKLLLKVSKWHEARELSRRTLELCVEIQMFPFLLVTKQFCFLHCFHVYQRRSTQQRKCIFWITYEKAREGGKKQQPTKVKATQRKIAMSQTPEVIVPGYLAIFFELLKLQDWLLFVF